MTIKFQSTFVRCEPIQIIEALVGLKDIRVLAYRRIGRDVELVIEQTVIQRTCPSCGGAGQIKERPTVRYVDLPVYGQPMRLAWRKHRLICRQPDCAGASWTSADHRIAAKNCLLTTRCAKWATVQVGTGRAVSDVAGELSCDWHTVNDAVMTYGRALLAADRHRRDTKPDSRSYTLLYLLLTTGIKKVNVLGSTSTTSTWKPKADRMSSSAMPVRPTATRNAK